MSTHETKVVQLRSRWLAVSLAAMACAFHTQPAHALNEASGAAPGLPVQSSGVVPFKIHVPDGVLSDLKDRIARMRYRSAISPVRR